jgi:hypothetical protein
VAINGGLIKGTVNGRNYGRLTGADSESRVQGKYEDPWEKQEHLSKRAIGEGKRRDSLTRAVYTRPRSRTRSAEIMKSRHPTFFSGRK